MTYDIDFLHTEEEETFIHLAKSPERWKHISEELFNITSKRYGEECPNSRLLIAVMVQAGKDYSNESSSAEDYESANEYLNGEQFEYDCKLLYLEPYFTKKLLTNSSN
jgi:hypothetical protein